MESSVQAAIRAHGLVKLFGTVRAVDIEDAERLCDRVAFIVSGRIVRTESLERLLQPVRGIHAMTVTVSGSSAVPHADLHDAFPWLDFYEKRENELRIETCAPIKAGSVARYLEDKGVEVLEARKRHLSLEDLFVEVTGIGSGSMTGEKEGRARR
ncbi:MAG: hypothetical protein FJY09_02095 [Chlorobi bacterium]|nr:hypothetical protein [Chlorobiota bacterium]